jgi:hypothetical protein
VNLCDIVPSILDFDAAVQLKIRNYLSESMVEIKQSSQTLTFNYASILRENNCIKIDVSWPKERIVVRHISPHSTITLTILP